MSRHTLAIGLAVLAILLNGCGKTTTVGLTISCNKTPCRDADVSIDGHLVGKMIEKAPGAFFLSAGVSPEPHELKVTKDGKVLYAEKFNPPAGASEHYLAVEPEPST
jgi:hypothetical protein